jgi:aspartate aminotransferase-like enzyme
MQLRIPGPTPCPEEVLKAQAKQMINHRGKEFTALIRKVTEQLKRCFQTNGDILILTASGTAGMEAAVVNTLSPGDGVLAVTIGSFGDRFADIATRYGADVKRLAFEWGHPADPDAIRDALRSTPQVKAVLVTHNETSTGVTNDLAAISKVVKEFDKLILVDGVSSVSSIDLPTDKWQCDVVVSGSQKGWMTPPGLVMVSMNERAWKAYDQAKMPRFYLDLGKAKKFFEEKGQTPWTPGVSTLYALSVGLDMIENETLPKVYERHIRTARAAREGVKSLGLKLFAQEAYASNTVTAIDGPAGVDLKKLLQILREEQGVVLSGGQGKLDGKIFRIGHLGWVSENDMKEVVKAVETALPRARG